MSNFKEVSYFYKKKKVSTYRTLALLFGGVGGHFFYVDKRAEGIACLFLCWTFLPLLVSIVCVFTAKSDVAEANIKSILKLPNLS